VTDEQCIFSTKIARAIGKSEDMYALTENNEVALNQVNVSKNEKNHIRIKKWFRDSQGHCLGFLQRSQQYCENSIRYHNFSQQKISPTNVKLY
jgi:hypothetical protein